MTPEDNPQAAAPAATDDSTIYDPEAALAVAEAELAALQDELALARKEADEATLRAQADLQNTRKRLERDAENTRKFMLEKFVGELLAVVDSLERGLNALGVDDEAQRPAREGMALTLKQLMDTLAKFGVTEVDPKGQLFDPQQHEAMAQLPNAEVPPNTVVEVLQKGFLLAGRLLRPAMVVVARAP